MIKKNHRYQLHETIVDSCTIEKTKKFIKSFKFFNKVFQTIFEIPDGYYKCPGCNAEGPIRFENSKRIKGSFLDTPDGDQFVFYCCEKCVGNGFVDFVSNVVDNDKKIYWNYPFRILSIAYNLDDIEITSIIFYMMYNKNDYLGFDLNKTVKDKKVQRFIEYFIEYKKRRDARKIFIENNFDDLRNELLKITKFNHFKKGKHKCTICNSQPFNLSHNKSYDTIELTICGKCYGQGYHTKKETNPLTAGYIYELIEPDYSDKSKMIDCIINNAELNKKDLAIDLKQIKDRK